MYRPDQIAVVIPCLNEGSTIGPLVREVRRWLPRVIVIDDGSSDATATEARTAGAALIQHEIPRGKGASLRAGFAAALNEGYSAALALDGDGQHSPSDIPKFLQATASSRAALLVGNRMIDKRAMPCIRFFVNHLMSGMLGTFCETPIPDSQCGFRLLDLHAWSRLSFSSNHFEIESEMIVRFLHAGYSIDFVPIETRYGSESSKIRPFADTLRWLRWWVAIRHELSSHAFVSVEPPYESAPQDATA